MKVRELIAKLQECRSDSDVYLTERDRILDVSVEVAEVSEIRQGLATETFVVVTGYAPGPF